MYSKPASIADCILQGEASMHFKYKPPEVTTCLALLDLRTTWQFIHRLIHFVNFTHVKLLAQ
jgi:hypothetical protein